MSQKRVLVSLSGGMDSATLLAMMVNEGHRVHAVSFLYGSKHNKYELEAAEQVAKHFNVVHSQIDLRQAFASTVSNLMEGGGPIPEGHYEDKTMKKTVVPGRNLIFASILASIAESHSMHAIALAVHSGDHAIYPDCRPDFIVSLTTTIAESTEGKVKVWAPLLRHDKTYILNVGIPLKVPYEITRTCYKDQPFACGRCGSCRERLEAWDKIGQRDPAHYA